MSQLHGIDITGRLGEPWRGTREEEQHWVQNVQRTIVSVRQSGLVAVVQSPNGGSLTFSRAASGKRGMARIVGTEINEDLWDRLGRALGEKNEQASGNLVWLRMGEYAGLWHWSGYREMTLEEKVQNLSPLVQAALASLPHIAGIILSSGIEPDLAPGGQLPSTFPRGDGAIAVHCALPGSCSRESIIIPRSGMSADAYTFAALYEHEVTWLDWALRQAGHPPFHDLVQDL